jgi:thiamine biosynthesis protein ThiS
MPTVSVRLFATLRRYYPDLDIGEAMPVEIEEEMTVADLLQQLELPEDQVKIVFVNSIVREADYELEEGDDLGIFPPVGGG